ncbi:MAG: signal recognition particle-docking protein FtsY [Geminicoccaceae bacterium]|nr:signal recognition particle-docking protein FtsY [Geminicoccaceae bacterium]MCX8101827.1 signal recognition particle-docking protein FtsY [Geminicoccaceae bacterium]MDW8370719.1 signal recognition particle-docking protein FtsY [Geminicoccaceae bacterium]
MSEQKIGWLGRLRAGLKRSSTAIKERLKAVVRRRRLDQETLDELEEVLIAADLGVETAQKLIAALKKERFGKEVSEEEVRAFLAERIALILEPLAQPIPHRVRYRPQVVLVCGVNGTGKTTTIGKLAKQARDAGLSVVLAACDTFRAAAVEQLAIWGERNAVPVIRGKEGADPAGLAFTALEKARADGADLLLIDTAGRLHNKQALMDELKKIVRVLKKLDPDAPHDTILVLDATTGQNAHNQVETFKSMVDVSGLIVTKLDGTAKGGVVVALAERFGLPIHAVGVGEGIEDLRPFEARAFARALLGLDEQDREEEIARA